MAKRKTDEELQNEMNLHSQNIIQQLQVSQKLHHDAIILGKHNRHEHSQIILKMAIQLHRFVIAESKNISRLQKILSKRLQKRIDKQKDDL